MASSEAAAPAVVSTEPASAAPTAASEKPAITEPARHPVFSTDPSEWLQYVYKEVCVRTEGGGSHSGRVYTVDPVSRTLVLAAFDGDQLVRLRAVLGHAVRDIVVLDDDADKYRAALDRLFTAPQELSLSPEQLSQRREKLRLWLLKNRIPVAVSKENAEQLLVADALTVEPPYGVENCQSTNEIILGRIQGLITSMPRDAHKW